MDLYWARLGYVRLVLKNPQGAADALEMSILTARYEPTLMLSRLDLAFIVWSYFGDEAKDLLTEQIRTVWKRQPDELLRAALKRNLLLPVHDELEEEEQRAFNDRLRKLPPR